jgi:hypothetical protein
MFFKVGFFNIYKTSIFKNTHNVKIFSRFIPCVPLWSYGQCPICVPGIIE